MGNDYEVRKTFTLSKEVAKALAISAAQQAADGLRSKKKAESEIIEEALRVMLGLSIEAKEEPEGE